MAGAERLGISQLDKLLPSIPTGSSVVLVNDPGVEAEPFLYQSAHAHLAEGTDVLYAVFNRAPSSVVQAMREYGFDPEGAKGRLRFIDGFSGLMGASEGARYTLANPRDLGEVATTIEEAAAKDADSVLFVDPLSTLVDHAAYTGADAALPSFQEMLPRIAAASRSFRLAASLFTDWRYGDLSQILNEFDAVVSLRGVEERVLLSQYFTVERAAWAGPIERRSVLYKTAKPGGVFVYIPKIVVTGPYGAGKSTFVQTLSESAVSVNRLGTTVTMDHGRITLEGLTADIFGTPGQTRFDPLIRSIAGQALGVVVVVDSTRPDTFARARDTMSLTWKQTLPILIAANKQDLPDALSLSEVRRRLEVPSHVQVVGCNARDRESCLAVLRQLVDQIMGVKVTA